MVPLTRRKIDAGSPHPRQEPEAAARAKSNRRGQSSARVRSEVGLQGRQRGEAIVWRRSLVFPCRTSTNESSQTLPTAVGVMAGVVAYRTRKNFPLDCVCPI